jgi:hypothetical protein
MGLSAPRRAGLGASKEATRLVSSKDVGWRRRQAAALAEQLAAPAHDGVAGEVDVEACSIVTAIIKEDMAGVGVLPGLNRLNLGALSPLQRG